MRLVNDAKYLNLIFLSTLFAAAAAAVFETVVASLISIYPSL